MKDAEITILRTSKVESKFYNHPILLMIDTDHNVYSCYNNTHALCATYEIFALAKPGDTFVVKTIPVRDEHENIIPKRYYVQQIKFKELVSHD